MSANPNRVSLAPVAITVAIIAGTTEPLTGANLSPGQRNWWIRRNDGTDRPWIDTDGRHRGTEPCTFTANLIPGGRYLVGVGSETRIRFLCPSVNATVTIDPNKGTANVVQAPAAPVSAVTFGAPVTVFHVRNAPIGSAARGVTYPTVADAMGALGTLAAEHGPDIAAGRIVVCRGPWPVASYPPPAPPVVIELAVPVYDDVADDAIGFAPAVSTVDAAGSTFLLDAPAETAGFEAPPPTLAIGQDRGAGWDHRPYAVDALANVALTVAREDRRDLHCRLADVTMDDSGRLLVNGTAYGAERTGFGELVTLRQNRSETLPRARALLECLPAPLRAAVWNSQNVAADTDDRAVIRTRLHGTRRAAFAVVTRGYSALDAGDIADIAREALGRIPNGDTARGTVHYNPGTTGLTVDVLFPGNVRGRRPQRADDGHVGGVRITSADNGTGAIKASTLVWRLVCKNGMMGFGPGTVERIVHRGNRAAMVARLATAIRSTATQASAVVDRFVALRETSLASLLVTPSDDGAANVLAIMRAIAGSPDDERTPFLPVVASPAGLVMPTDGIARDVLVEQLLSAFGREPGDTLADVVNAVTRLHTERVPVPVVRIAEEHAGMLAYTWA